DGAHPDQGEVMNRARMDYHVMGYRDAIPEDRRNTTAKHMDGRVVLNVYSFSDSNETDIPAHHSVEPDTRLGADVHVSNHLSTLLHIRTRVDLGSHSLMSNDHATLHSQSLTYGGTRQRSRSAILRS